MTWRKAAIFTAVGLLALYVVLELGMNPVLHRLASQACPECNLRWTGARLEGAALVIDGLEFAQGSPDATLVSGKVGRLRVVFHWRALFRHQLAIREITMDHPVVVVEEGDRKAPHGAGEGGEPAAWSFSGDRISIVGGEFTYIRRRKEGPAVIQVHEIGGSVSRWSSADPALWTTGTAEGVLERSGRFVLGIEAPLFGPRAEARVALHLKGLHLEEMNPFFLKDESLELDGHVLTGEAVFHYVERAGDATVAAQYRGLKVKFHSRPEERSGLSAFLESQFAIAELAPDSDPRRVEPERARRERGGESLVSFVLRGYRDAALKVAKKRNAK